MDYEHDIATQAAVRALPPWAYRVIKPLEEIFTAEYSHGLDRSEGEASPFKKYVAFWKDDLPLHYLPGSDTVERNYDRAYDGFLFYFRHMAGAFAKQKMKLPAASRGVFPGRARAGWRRRINEGVLFASMLFHFLQDAGYLQHSLDSPQGFAEPGSCTPWPKIIQLFPPPPGKEHAHAVMIYKNILSRSLKIRGKLSRLSLNDYAPKLLGITPEEASFHLYQRYWRLLAEARASMPGFFSAAYERSETKYARICKTLIQNCAQVCADVLYTALCIAFNKFSPAQTKILEKTRLESLVPLVRPFFSATAAYTDCPIVKDCNLDTKLRRHRLALLVKTKRGTAVRYFRHGLGTGMGWQEPEQSPSRNSCDYHLRYKIPARVYRWFTVTCGVNATMPHAGKISLRVCFNGKQQCSTGIIAKPALGKTMKVNVRSGGTLDMVARNEKTNPLSPPFPQVHIVWADPLLLK